MLEKLKDKDNSTVYLTVVKKLSLKTESTAFTKASVFQLLVFSPTEHSISEAMMPVRDSYGVTSNNKKAHPSFQNSCSLKS